MTELTCRALGVRAEALTRSGVGRRQPATWAGTARAGSSRWSATGGSATCRREHPGPDGQGSRSGSSSMGGPVLGRDLGQGQGQDGGGGQLAAVAPADGGAAAGDDVVDQAPQGGVLLGGVGDRPGSGRWPSPTGSSSSGLSMVYCTCESNTCLPQGDICRSSRPAPTAHLVGLGGQGKLGVTRQREDCQRIADRLGWNISDWYIDNNRGRFAFEPVQG